MRKTIFSLILAGACLLWAAPAAEARQPYRTYFPPRYSGVYMYPQISTVPRYYVPPYYGYSYYPSFYYPSVYNYSYYNPGAYRYWYSPYGGTSYYYRNPSFYSWYWIR